VANEQVFPHQKPKIPNIKTENKASGSRQVRMAGDDDFS